LPLDVGWFSELVDGGIGGGEGDGVTGEGGEVIKEGRKAVGGVTVVRECWTIRQAASSSGRPARTRPRACTRSSSSWSNRVSGEVSGPEHGRFEGWSRSMRADPLQTSSHFDHPRSEPAGHVKPVEDVGGVAQMLADGRPVGHLGAAIWMVYSHHSSLLSATRREPSKIVFTETDHGEK
jgi:hypothetical protein